MSYNIRVQPAYFVTGDPETENNASLLYPGMLGGRATIKEPGVPGSATTAGQFRSKTYQLVQSDSSMTTNPFKGAVAWWSDKTKYLVTTNPATLGRGRIAGVFRGNVTPGNYCWIQTQGPCPNVKFVDAPTSIPDAVGLGTFVIPSATAGKADNLAAGSSPTYPILGLSAGSWNPGDNTATVDLDIPETP